MASLIECVPNVSEGRDETVLQTLAEAVRSVPGVALLHRTMDPDHHRAVLTFAGAPKPVAEAAFCVAREAIRRIDLTRHHGVHPRVGAVDVIPFVPLQHVTLGDCVEIARHVGQRIGAELDIPVFLYERTATRPNRVPLESIRRGGLPGLAGRMTTDLENWRPDFGPAALHPTAGATVVGARPLLVAFNINLRTQDLAHAQAIARAVRASGGGLPCVKAIGVPLPSRGLVQVAINVTDVERAPLHRVFDAVQQEAAARHVEIVDSELIGLVPRAALAEAPQDFLALNNWDPALVLDRAIEQAFGAPKTPKGIRKTKA
jgi:glutamate formiminotransferase/glutamate formiminotransferase/formiminotetrahydrofolate cyclodeaminase